MDWIWLVAPSLCIWVTILILPWQPWRTRETLDPAAPHQSPDLTGITVLIPARNEARHIESTLRSLSVQGRGLRIILIDDESTDGTAERAASLHLPDVTIIKGKPLAEGWSGKLWALEQGRQIAVTRHLLLLDADINLAPGLIGALLGKLQQDNLQFLSLMAYLKMETAWEKMLMPAFIYFFKLLYPFRLSNSGSGMVAAAAGGCILIDRLLLDKIGGFAAVRGQLIDDCALARQVKAHGCRTWIGLSHSVLSQRSYDNLRTVWEMVTRTAFTQLRYSVLLLLLCTMLMLAAFVMPVAGLFSGDVTAVTFSSLTLILMGITYMPTLHYYGVNPAWVCGLPLTGLLYLLMTWGSALNHWRGHGSTWKGRNYTECT
jgi:hopene-associated glycosyltransferase HpnB